MRCLCGFETDNNDEMVWHLGQCEKEPTSKWEAHLTCLETDSRVGSLSEQLEGGENETE